MILFLVLDSLTSVTFVPASRPFFSPISIIDTGFRIPNSRFFSPYLVHSIFSIFIVDTGVLVKFFIKYEIYKYIKEGVNNTQTVKKGK